MNVFASVENYPNVTIRKIAYDLEKSRESVRKILKKHKFKKVTISYNLHQALHEANLSNIWSVANP